MRIVIAEPNRAPVVRDVEATLENLQKLVGGYLEMLREVPASEPGLVFYFNEDGRALGLTHNRTILGGYAIVGPIVVLGTDPDSDTERGLTDAEVTRAVEILGPGAS